MEETLRRTQERIRELLDKFAYLQEEPGKPGEPGEPGENLSPHKFALTKEDARSYLTACKDLRRVTKMVEKLASDARDESDTLIGGDEPPHLSERPDPSDPSESQK